MCKIKGIDRSNGEGAGTCAPLSVQFLLFSCSFWQNFSQMMGFYSKLRGRPLHLGNPGYATERSPCAYILNVD